ncbi:hypothetical protein LLH00_09370 [bacterium]|nr:hypothetical protein [bacterium]
MRSLKAVLLGLSLILAACAGSGRQAAVWLPVGADSTVVFEDDFSACPAGDLSAEYTAVQEYHWVPKTPSWGPWNEASHWMAWDGPSWSVRAGKSGQVLHQNNEALLEDSNPLVLTGDPLWTDYALEVELAPQATSEPVGIVYRAATSAQFYMLSLEEGSKWVWTRRIHDAWTKLKIRELKYKPGQSHTLRVEVQGVNQVFYVDGRQMDILRRDHYLQAGRVGLIANSPCDFRRVRVIMSRAAREDWLRRKAEKERLEQEASQQYPQPALWKQIDLHGLAVNGRQVRWGDLDGDGRLEFVLAQRAPGSSGPLARSLSGLTAFNLDGEILWQWGVNDTVPEILATDLPYQVVDLDHDGRCEVALSHDFKVEFLDGRTGVSLAVTPTPEHGPKHPDSFYAEDQYERIPAGVLYFCDLTGRGSVGDYLIKDDYNNIWAYSRDFKQLWTANLNAGHYPYARDIDGDGRDEVIQGYCMFDHDGRRMFDLQMQDHSDAVFVGRAGDPACFPGWHTYFCSGEEGLMVGDTCGNIHAKQILGHVQRMAVADFRPELPGCEMAQCTYWGNLGVVSLHAQDGRKLWEAQPGFLGSMCLAVDWVGDGSALLLISADDSLGGMWDGFGRRVVRFSDPGHPELTMDVVNLTGDSRDELVMWDTGRMWVYTQDRPAPGGKPAPRYKMPLYSRSNYQMSVAIPE